MAYDAIDVCAFVCASVSCSFARTSVRERVVQQASRYAKSVAFWGKGSVSVLSCVCVSVR